MALLGAQALKRDFRAINNAVQNSLRRAAIAGAMVVREEARRRAPRKTGHGARYIIAKRGRGRAGLGNAAVGFAKPAFYLLFFEKGARPHFIPASLITKVRDPKTRSIIRKVSKKRAVLVTNAGRFVAHRMAGAKGKVGVWSPGIRRAPFLADALTQSASAVVTRMGEVFNAAMNAAIEKKGLA